MKTVGVVFLLIGVMFLAMASHVPASVGPQILGVPFAFVGVLAIAAGLTVLVWASR